MQYQSLATKLGDLSGVRLAGSAAEQSMPCSPSHSVCAVADGFSMFEALINLALSSFRALGFEVSIALRL